MAKGQSYTVGLPKGGVVYVRDQSQGATVYSDQNH